MDLLTKAVRFFRSSITIILVASLFACNNNDQAQGFDESDALDSGKALTTSTIESGLSSQAVNARTSNGLQVLYTFEEGVGTTITDVSGKGTPLNLSIESPTATRWMPGRLSINGTTLIASNTAADKVTNALKASKQLSIEAWLAPANTNQGGPARIVTLSQSPTTRNFTLGQANSAFNMRLRTTNTSNNGLPSTSTTSNPVTTALTHVVFTRDTAGNAAIYVNGSKQANATVGGDFNNWSSNFRLALANEFNGDRPWQGELHLVAIFDRALSSTEVSQNFNAGPDTTSSTNQPPSAQAGPDQTVNEGSNVNLNASASSDPDGSIIAYRWQQLSGPAVTLSDTTGISPSFTAPSVTTSTLLTFNLTVTDNDGASVSDSVGITVIPPTVIAPDIITQPVDQTVNEGQTATFSVVTTGSSPLNYQWRRNYVAIAGATAARYTTPATDLADNGMVYDCVISNAAGSIISNGAVLGVLATGPNQLPIANAGPNQTTNEGSNVNLNGSASSDPDGSIIAYRWQQLSGPAVTLSDTTGISPSFTAPSVTTSTLLTFNLTVTDNDGASVSDSVGITVIPPTVTAPGITTQPMDQTINEGQTATFSVVTTGSSPLNYQWRRNYVAIAGATAARYTTPATDLADNGMVYDCVISNNAGSIISNGAILSVLPSSSTRTSNGLQVLYTFEEGVGTTITDVSGKGIPLNLSIESPTATRWMPGRLSINGTTLIASNTAADKVTNALKASKQLSIEAWLAPANTNQGGPARIVTLSQSPTTRNFTLGQANSAFNMRLRTTNTSNNGLPSTSTTSNPVTTALTHVVFTRDTAGNAAIYVNGSKQANATVGGDFNNWSSNFRLALANEFNGDRPWQGELHLVAIFDRALSSTEVSQNFNAGPDTTSSTNQPPSAQAGPDQTVNEGSNVNLNASASSDPDGSIIAYRWQQLSGPAVTLSDTTGISPSFTAPSVTTSTLLTFNLTVTDNSGASASDNISIEVRDNSASATPFANDDTAVTSLNTAVIINVTANDTGLEDTPYITSVFSPPSQGSAVVRSPNSIEYIPEAGFAGTDSFVYQIVDNDNDLATASVSIDVTCPFCAANTVVTVTWNKNPSNISGYKLYYGTSALTTDTLDLLQTIPNNTNGFDPNNPAANFDAWNDLGLNKGDSVCFRVKAYNLTSSSNFSDAACKLVP